MSSFIRFLFLQSLFFIMFLSVLWMNSHSTPSFRDNDRDYQPRTHSFVNGIRREAMQRYAPWHEPVQLERGRVLVRTHVGLSHRWHQNSVPHADDTHSVILLPRLAHAHITDTVHQVVDIMQFSRAPSLTMITVVWLEREGRPLYDALHAMHDEGSTTFRELVVVLAPMHLFPAYLHAANNAAMDLLLDQLRSETLSSRWGGCIILSPFCSCAGRGEWCFDHDPRNGGHPVEGIVALDTVLEQHNASSSPARYHESFHVSEFDAIPVEHTNTVGGVVPQSDLWTLPGEELPKGSSIWRQLMIHRPHFGGPLNCQTSMLQM